MLHKYFVLLLLERKICFLNDKYCLISEIIDLLSIPNFEFVPRNFFNGSKFLIGDNASYVILPLPGE